MIHLTKYEQETIINYNSGEKTAQLCTRDPVVMRKMEKLALRYPDTYKFISADEVTKNYEFPKRMLTFRGPVERTLTEEQKEAARERLRAYREARRSLRAENDKDAG